MSSHVNCLFYIVLNTGGVTIRKGILVVAVVIATRTIGTIPLGSRTQHHPVNKQNG